MASHARATFLRDIFKKAKLWFTTAARSARCLALLADGMPMVFSWFKDRVVELGGGGVLVVSVRGFWKADLNVSKSGRQEVF